MLIGYEREYCINSGQSWNHERLCWDSRRKPPQPRRLWPRLKLPLENKGASKKTIPSTISDFQRKLFNIPFTGKCPWANLISPNERHFKKSRPSLKYHKKGAERPTTTLHKTPCSKPDKPWETEQSMPAPWIRILDFSEHSHQDEVSAKWAQCKHQFVIVKIT